MKALIVHGCVREFVDESTFPKVPHPDVELVAAPPNVKVGWFYKGGKFKAPNKYGMEDGPHDNYVNAQLAKQALVLSDRVMIRCYESDVKAPTNWINYRAQLRRIIEMENDTSSAPINVPETPPIPAGLK